MTLAMNEREQEAANTRYYDQQAKDGYADGVEAAKAERIERGLAAVLADPMTLGDVTAVTMFDEDWLILADEIIAKLEAAGFIIVAKDDVEHDHPSCCERG